MQSAQRLQGPTSAASHALPLDDLHWIIMQLCRNSTIVNEQGQATNKFITLFRPFFMRHEVH